MTNLEALAWCIAVIGLTLLGTVGFHIVMCMIWDWNGFWEDVNAKKETPKKRRGK